MAHGGVTDHQTSFERKSGDCTVSDALEIAEQQ